MQIQPIILAGGKGTRMESELPKVLVPLGGKPMIEYVLDTVESVGALLKPLVVVGYKKELVMESLGERCSYVVQEEQLGTGHAVSCAMPSVTAPYVCILYGDMPFVDNKDINAMILAMLPESGKGLGIDEDISCNEGTSVLINQNMSHKRHMVMATVTVDDFTGERSNLEKYGRIVRTDGQIVGIIEYKDANDAERAITEVNPSYFIIETEWLRVNLQYIGSHNASNEYYLTDIVKIAIEQGYPIQTVSIDHTSALGANTASELAVLEAIMKR